MAKDSKGHGSARHAVGIVEHHGSNHEVHIGPSRAAVAAGRGWTQAVSMKRPGEVAKVHENLAKAKARLESHPGFKGWKSGPKNT